MHLQSIVSALQTLVAFAIVLGLAVLLHEAGHFAAAKAMGVRVLEFAFGFPPKLFTLFRRNGTEYNICALPIGGYVKLAGMEPGEDGGPDGFNNKPVWMRMLVYFAGPFMNFVLAAIIFIGMGTTVGVPVTRPQDGATIVGLMADQPAQKAGFQPGDHVIAVNGRKVDFDGLLKTVRGAAGQDLAVTVDRDGKQSILHVTPAPNAKENNVGQIGVQLQPFVMYSRVGPAGAVTHGLGQTWNWTQQTIIGIGKLFHDREARKDVGGPVMIAVLAGKAFREGAVTFLTFLGVISINLGVLNLLPLLVVDGGHIALLALEWVRGRKLQPSLQLSFQVVGMVLILLAMALLSVRDISKVGKF